MCVCLGGYGLSLILSYLISLSYVILSCIVEREGEGEEFALLNGEGRGRGRGGGARGKKERNNEILVKL